MNNLTGSQKANIFLGAVVGFALGYFLGPKHKDKSSNMKSFVFEIIGAAVGAAIVYGWIKYKQQ